MTTETINHSTEEDLTEESMDKQLFLIKEKLPKEIVAKLSETITVINGVNHIVDFEFFVIIEFNTIADANVARANGLQFDYNGQRSSINYSPFTAVTMYMRETCREIGAVLGNRTKGY